MIFSADDWGFSPGINEGILDLARQNKLFSVSCSANTPYLHHGLEELLTFAKKGVHFHIHFTLTYGCPVSPGDCIKLVGKDGKFFNFHSFVFKGLAGLIPSSEIAAEFQAQMKVLTDLNIPVSGLDGHHHIHLFPFVYGSIKNDLHKFKIQFVRTMGDSEHMASYFQSLFFKKFVFKESQSIGLSECGYLLTKNLKNQYEMTRKLKKFPRILVHPAQYNDFAESGMTDSLQEQRVHELICIKELYCE